MKKADIILVVAVLAIAAVLVFVLYGLNGNSGAYVQIEVNGEIVETLSLSEDTEREIESADGGKNTLVISGGSAKMTQANCPDGICTNHKAISRNGESIICLPHKTVITVVNEKDIDNGVDAVA